MRMNKIKALLAAAFLATLLMIGGCASTEHYPVPDNRRTESSKEIDKDKIHKKTGDSDDMERLD